MPGRTPVRYVRGYPVYGGTFGDRGAVQSFEQRVATGSAGPYPGWDMYGGSGGSGTDAMPPAAGGIDPGGYQPVDAYGYPINPGVFSPASGGVGYDPGNPYAGVSGSAYAPTPPSGPMGDYTGTTGISPEPSPIPGNAATPPGGYPIDVASPTDPFGGGSVSGTAGGIPGVNSPTGNFNYYDAGNGVVYVYDSNWQYVGTTQNSAANIGQNAFQGGGVSGTTSTGSPVSTAFNSNNNAPTARPGGWDIFGSSVNWGPSGGIGPQPNIADTAITGSKPANQLL